MIKLGFSSKYKIFFFSACGVFICSFFVKMYFSGEIVSKNIKLKNLYEKKISLEKEISKLSYISSELSSLSNVESRAKQLGFVQMEEPILSLDPYASVPLASR